MNIPRTLDRMMDHGWQGKMEPRWTTVLFRPGLHDTTLYFTPTAISKTSIKRRAALPSIGQCLTTQEEKAQKLNILCFFVKYKVNNHSRTS
ncbi:hypothetical protein FPOAC1_012032 [Fusarium poae]|uniref:hypothetical protein n=1 Tax=Fusarium poae TaxID=36050 RepID=UPI001CE857C1|nr:hypothetical protein FPOAC1_012032 [Fusarium poae]KAG8667207.1 hypothetical protein FPOAC1_012032 [Fusarium poae]